MTFRTSINSKGDPRKFLKRGFKSMFSNYQTDEKETPPPHRERDQEKKSGRD